ncbi:hypothetical protein POTOM_011206 [Populus tomentosa]|uniref:Uncharacterized protein n=1 Tax=Populus tomentosa TaxID=118781 RepID=A0A8X8A9E6_POPTO|nr:hypothetical protein POTOM_011206 [Populus tomentosa]
MLVLQLTLMAKKSRISAPKLQKALVGICRICESHLATYLVQKHYHSRIASGKQDLQSQRYLLSATLLWLLGNEQNTACSPAAVGSS